jgi:hypothetical protein
LSLFYLNSARTRERIVVVANFLTELGTLTGSLRKAP